MWPTNEAKCTHTSADRVHCESAGEERNCDSLLLETELGAIIFGEVRQGVDSGNSGPCGRSRLRKCQHRRLMKHTGVGDIKNHWENDDVETRVPDNIASIQLESWKISILEK